MDIKVSTGRKLNGSLAVPGDKSISHRVAILASLAEGRSRLGNFLFARDTLSTLQALKALGVQIEYRSAANELIIEGAGLRGLKEPENVIDTGNSGTTMRLLSGLLAGQPFLSILTGDSSLRRRPMGRIIKPLREMGAHIISRSGEVAPLVIQGGNLKGISYELPIASAQVKSAILLAALFAESETTLSGKIQSRDHTERLLNSVGVSVNESKGVIKISPPEKIDHLDLTIPGDFSSAAYFIVAALLISGSDVIIEGVGLNPTRTGFLEVLKQMGARFKITSVGELTGEPLGEIKVRSSQLKGAKVGGALIPYLIDEIPILALAMTQAKGVSEVRDAQELRVKESDRISAIATELQKMGAHIEEKPDGFVVEGPTKLRGCRVKSHGDHRIAMALLVAGLVSEGETVVEDSECIDVSFPGFTQALFSLAG
jgi:3-phosphoshikimate 1-carboxyvinyltransferase